MKQREREKRRFKKRRIWYVLVLFVIGGYGSLMMLVTPVYAPEPIGVGTEHQEVSISWPQTGSASIGSSESIGTLGSFHGDTPVSSASTIKLLTALLVLQQKPLGPSEQGEAIYFGADDVQRFNTTVAQGGVALPVPQDTTITYREALDAMLVDSANNIADKLAIWAYGSIDAYVAATKTYTQQNLLTHTTVTDASGLLPTTKTSADDMVGVAKLAMKVPVLAAIVKQRTATLADGRVLTNTNTLLSLDGVIGLKTGNTVEAGYCLVAVKRIVVFGRERFVYASVFGQPSHEAADQAAASLLHDTEAGFEEVVVASKSQPVANYRAPWGEKVDVLPGSDIKIVKWRGEGVSAALNISPRAHAKQGDNVGQLTLAGESFDLVLSRDLPKPSLWWRVVHAVDYIRQKL